MVSHPAVMDLPLCGEPVGHQFESGRRDIFFFFFSDAALPEKLLGIVVRPMIILQLLVQRGGETY